MPTPISWINYTVSWKTALSADDWTAEPELKCTRLTRGLAPTIDEADLEWEFGHITGRGEAENAYVARLDLLGKFVRIEVPDLDIDWVGYVGGDECPDRWAQEDDGGGAQRISGGDVQFTAFGLEYFLARETVNTSYFRNPADDEEPIRIERAIGFNSGFGEGRDITYATRGNKSLFSNADAIFPFANDPDEAEPWEAAQAIKYLLLRHGPQDVIGNKRPVPFFLDDAAIPYVEWYFPTVLTAGRSIFQVLNDHVDRKRGLVWWLDYLPPEHDFPNGKGIIHITSLATSDITLPGSLTLPVNSNLVSLDDIEGYTYHVNVRRGKERKYDVVHVRGARRRAIFTASVAGGTLVPSWTSAEETAYATAAGSDDPIDNDRFRQALRFERVYQAFHIPITWNGKVSSTDYACPEFVPGSTSITGGAPLCLPGLRLERTLPMKVGWDYTDPAHPVNRDPTSTAAEFQRPFAMIDLSGDGDWVHTTDINTNEFEPSSEDEVNVDPKTNYHLRPLDSTPGILLTPTGGMPHAIALNHFDPDTASPSDHEPEVDFQNLICTVSGEWDSYCEGRYPLADPSTGSRPVERLWVQLGHLGTDERARFDWMSKGTVVDCKNGTLEVASDGVALRDDRKLCEQLARAAFEWYGVERAEVTISLTAINEPAHIGDLITTIGSGAAQETVNAVVSQITHNLEGGTTEIHAGFAELAFEELV